VTLLRLQTGLLAKPEPTAVSKPFWEGCLIHELRFQRCQSCRAAVHSPSTICWRCWSTELVWERSTGHGTVYSWTVVWRPVSAEFEVPYAPVIVELDEGWHLLSNLVGAEHDEITVGMAVRVVYGALGDFVLPFFEPAGP
jgi:uncharacterized protein